VTQQLIIYNYYYYYYIIKYNKTYNKRCDNERDQNIYEVVCYETIRAQKAHDLVGQAKIDQKLVHLEHCVE